MPMKVFSCQLTLVLYYIRCVDIGFIRILFFAIDPPLGRLSKCLSLLSSHRNWLELFPFLERSVQGTVVWLLHRWVSRTISQCGLVSATRVS